MPSVLEPTVIDAANSVHFFGLFPEPHDCSTEDRGSEIEDIGGPYTAVICL